jgi:hypothetical protein
MKKEIKKLELSKLFKEFSFLKIDEEYKQEVQNTYGQDFSMAIQDLFKKYPDINLLYNNKAPEQPNSEITAPIQETIGTDIYKPLIEGIGEEITLYNMPILSPENKEPEKSSEIKKLYRKIATKTHPDKVSSKFLNDAYMRAKNAYQANDLFSIYLICDELKLDFEFPKEELKNFKTHIRDLKNRNSFVEQTFLWAWAHEENEDIKKNILLQYLVQLQKVKI